MPGIIVRFGSERMTASSTISSAVMMTVFAAKAASFCSPMMPHKWALPSTSARCTWTMATSGCSAGTTMTSLPPNGSRMRLMFGLAFSRSVAPVWFIGRNGRPDAPACKRVIIPKWEYSSHSSLPCSIAERTMRSDPTPGLPMYEKITLRAQPAATIWS